jgi:hypothetical protein
MSYAEKAGENPAFSMLSVCLQQNNDGKTSILCAFSRIDRSSFVW